MINYIISILISLPSVLIALTVHESAHGYAAYKLGDPTAMTSGRISLNPMKHIDPFGFICMVFFRFGWAKPVPVNARNFKKPKRDMALTALAGPVSNLLLAFFGVLLYAVISKIVYAFPMAQYGTFTYNLRAFTLLFFENFFMLNISLAVFNLIPVPPLDGSRILLTVIPQKYYFGIMRYERYIVLGLIVLLYLNVLNRPLNIAVNFVYQCFAWIVNLIPFL